MSSFGRAHEFLPGLFAGKYCVLMFPPQAYITLWHWKFPCSMSVPFFFFKKDHLALAFCCVGEPALLVHCCCTVISHNKLPYSPWHNEQMKTSYNPTDSEIVVSGFACTSSAPSIPMRTLFLGPKKPRKGCALDSCKYGIYVHSVLIISPSETILTNLLFGRWWRGTARLRARLPLPFITRSRTLPLSRIVTSLLTNKTITHSWKWLLRTRQKLHIHIKAWYSSRGKYKENYYNEGSDIQPYTFHSWEQYSYDVIGYRKHNAKDLVLPPAFVKLSWTPKYLCEFEVHFISIYQFVWNICY